MNNALYRVTGDRDGRVDATSQNAQVVFEFEGAGGLRVRKEFAFAPTNYVVTFSATAADGARTLQPAIAWGPGLGDAGAIAAGGSFFTGNYTSRRRRSFTGTATSSACCADKLAEEGSTKGSFDLRASTITTSSRPRSIPGKPAWNTGR